MPLFDVPSSPVRRRLSGVIACLTAAGISLACAPLGQPLTSAPPQPALSASAPAPVVAAPPLLEPSDLAARQLLVHHERLSALAPAELAQEVKRLSASDSAHAPQDAMLLALALSLSRANGDLARAQDLLEQVRNNPAPQALPWHAPARLLAGFLAEQQRSAEQIERLNQQLRETQHENQRKLDQLNDKLEALKAIERSLNSRPAPGPSSAAKSGPAP